MRNILAFCLLVPTIAFGWGDLGHETSAHIAQRFLTEEALVMVEDILGPELLSVSATWPDSVRDDKDRYKVFADYHLCDLPDGTKDPLAFLKKDPHNCYAVVTKGDDVLNDPKVSDNAKMVVLRYIIHVTGDLHQPLHVGNGFDLGANLCDIRIPPKDKDDDHLGTKTVLHSYWDTGLVQNLSYKKKSEKKFKGFFGSRDLANAIIEDHKNESIPSLVKVNEIAFDWIKESGALRAKTYPDKLAGQEDATPKTRVYCKWIDKHAGDKDVHQGAYDETKLPTITKEWEDESVKLVEEQLWKAGTRLAALLNEMATRLPKPQKPAVPPLEEILKGMDNTAN